MKKISMSLVALAFALVIPFSSVDASGNGSWDFLGKYYLHENSTYGWFDTANFYSTGGDIEIYIYYDDPSGKYELWESDPGPGNDDYVGSRDPYEPKKKIFRNINRFVDGSNNRAEFYVKSEHHNLALVWD